MTWRSPLGSTSLATVSPSPLPPYSFNVRCFTSRRGGLVGVTASSLSTQFTLFSSRQQVTFVVRKERPAQQQSWTFTQEQLLRGGSINGTDWSALHTSRRCFGTTPFRLAKNSSSQIQRVDKEEGEEEEEQGGGDDGSRGYLPFPMPFHTFNIIMLLFLGNILCYLFMRLGTDNTRDFLVEHCTLSRENWKRIYPLFTSAFFQENLLQLLIDCWLLTSVGNTLLSFVGNARLTWLCCLCVLGGGVAHLAKQQYFLFNGEDELVVRGRVYGPNTFIMGLIALEGLIFRHLTFVQQPPIPYLVLTAFVMALDVWRISTMQAEEHGAATGGALMALVFWALPIRLFGMDKLTAMV